MAGAAVDDWLPAVSDMRSQAERLNRLLNNLLLLARLDIGTETESEPIFVMPTLNRVVEEHQRRFSSRQINVTNNSRRFNVDGVQTRIPAFGQETYVEQVIANLLNNAEKYSSTSEPIDVEVLSGRKWRLVRVMDRGIGLKMEDIPHIFDPFYRSDEARKRADGLGIGLAVCKRLVEVQGGRIWARPRAGGGSEFGFALKLALGEETTI
jgi:signal transduction histidine kinase